VRVVRVGCFFVNFSIVVRPRSWQLRDRGYWGTSVNLGRRFLLAIGLALGTRSNASANDGRTGPSSTGAADAPLREVSPASSAKIAVLGDSLADGIWGALYRKLHRDRRHSVYRGAKNSVGFGGENLIDMIDRAFAGTAADAVVMMIGANDRRGVYVDGKLEAAYRSPQWSDAYRRRVEQFMDQVGVRRVPLVWILLPVMREEDASRDARQINSIIKAASETRPDVHLIETWALMSDEQGNYAAYVKDAKGQSRLLRHSDGVHFSDWGYEMMADAAFNQLLAVSPPLRSMASAKAAAP